MWYITPAATSYILFIPHHLIESRGHILLIDLYHAGLYRMLYDVHRMMQLPNDVVPRMSSHCQVMPVYP